MRRPRPRWPHEKEEAGQQKQPRNCGSQRPRQSAPEQGNGLVFAWGAVFIGKRREDPVPELRRELQRVSRSSELVRKGPRGLLLLDQRLAAGSACGQMSLRRRLRPRREAPL